MVRNRKNERRYAIERHPKCHQVLCICEYDANLNLNSLLVKRQIDNTSPGAVTRENKSLALTRQVNLDTLSSDSSEEEIGDSGRSFQSLIVWEKKLNL